MNNKVPATVDVVLIGLKTRRCVLTPSFDETDMTRRIPLLYVEITELQCTTAVFFREDWIDGKATVPSADYSGSCARIHLGI